MLIKKSISIILLIALTHPSFCQLQRMLPDALHIEKISPDALKQTFTFAIKDSSRLDLDLYSPGAIDSTKKKPCIIFIFGGAFIAGRRDDSIYNNYFNALISHNYLVVSASYRLGMKGVQHLSKFNITPLKNAINMAVEDIYDCTSWIISNASRFGIDTSRIVLSGSSSGAITALESDFYRRNNNTLSKRLPGDFEYAGVVAFSGAILSFDWGLKYKIKPAPTMMFHGTADKIVPYNKIRFLNKGFFGSSWIAKTFKKNNDPYYIYRVDGMGHEISVLPMINRLPLILDFLNDFVVNQKPLQIDTNFKDPTAKPILTINIQELLEKLK